MPSGRSPPTLSFNRTTDHPTALQMVSLSTSADADVPIVRHLWTADPAAHVFGERLWIYTSHDRNAGDNETYEGAGRFNMRDYRAFSFGDTRTAPRDEGVVLSLEAVPWARRQLWAPDVIRDEAGLYHLFFPAKDEHDRFRIGHAQATPKPTPRRPFRDPP